MSQEKTYPLGDQVRVLAIFRQPDEDGVMQIGDPDTVKFSYKAPYADDVELVYGTDTELVRESEGRYRVDLGADTVGRWRYKFFAEGRGKAAQKGHFKVEADDF